MIQPTGTERCVRRDRQSACARSAGGAARRDCDAHAGLPAHPEVPAAGGPVSWPGLSVALTL